MSFPAHERARLLAAPGIGPRVLARLEAVGIDSIALLQRLGVDAAVQAACRDVGSPAWANRRNALRRALGAALPAGARLG